MRIAGDNIRRNYLSRYEKNYSDKYSSEKKIFSGRQFDRGSENPINAARALRVRRSISEVESYQDNLKTADSIYTNAESAMLAVSGILQNVYEKLVQGAHGTYNQDDLNIIANDIDNYAEEMVQSFNIDIADRKVFGGMNNDSVAFKIEGSADGKYVTYNGVAVNSTNDPDAFPYPGVSFLDIGIGLSTDATTNRIDDQSALPITFNGAKCTGCGMTSKTASIDLTSLIPNQSYTFDISAGGQSHKITFTADPAGNKDNNINIINEKLKDAFLQSPQVGTDGSISGGNGYWQHYDYEPAPLNSDGTIQMDQLQKGKYYSLNVSLNGKTRVINFQGGTNGSGNDSEGLNKALENLDKALKSAFGERAFATADGQIKYGYGDTGTVKTDLTNISSAGSGSVQQNVPAGLVGGTEWRGADISNLEDGVTYSIRLAVSGDSMPFTNDDFKRITFAGSSDTETARANFEASVQAEFGPYATVNGIGVVSYDYASAGGTVNHVEARTDYVEEYVYLSKYESGKEYAININQALTDKQGNPITDEDGNIVYDDGEMVYFTAGDTPEETAANINEYIKNNGIYGRSEVPYVNESGTLVYEVDGANIVLGTDVGTQSELPYTDIDGYSKNIIQLVLDAGKQLKNGDQDMVARYADLVFAAQSNLSIAISDLGTHSKFIEFNQDRLDDVMIGLKTKQNDLESTELEDEITNWKVLESVYNATLQMGSSILSQSIFDYIH